jgi:hypothetical protein
MRAIIPPTMVVVVVGVVMVQREGMGKVLVLGLKFGVIK